MFHRFTVFKLFIPIKSAVFRVTKVSFFVNAVEAMIASGNFIVFVFRILIHVSIMNLSISIT